MFALNIQLSEATSSQSNGNSQTCNQSTQHKHNLKFEEFREQGIVLTPARRASEAITSLTPLTS
jgi:hypothetical protein